MLSFAAFIFVLLNVSKCELIGDNSNYNYTLLNGSKIFDIEEYCKERRCVAKCCNGVTEFFNNKKKCVDMSHNETRTIQDFSIQIYRSDIEEKITKSNMTLKDLTFLNNDKFFKNELDYLVYGAQNDAFNLYVVEDGSFVFEKPNFYLRFERLNGLTDYCIEVSIVKNRYRVYIATVVEDTDDENTHKDEIFTPISMLVSSFFMLLVLVVYGALPQLRNLKGKLLMAYVVNLLVWFMTRAISNLYIFDGDECNIISPILYFAFLASCMWLNIMSFDIWRTLRDACKTQVTNRGGELAKFLWYCLYAWGVPLAITIGTVVLDRSQVAAEIVKPHFDSCFFYVYENLLYMYIPITIVTIINCLLFMLTVYNIWLIQQGIGKFDAEDSQNNKNKARFCLYIKLSVMMGISWILEIIQTFANINETWLFILVNSYNTFLGVAIFFVFVFKKSVYIMLCKRFRINNNNLRKNTHSSTKYTGKSESLRHNFSSDEGYQTSAMIEVETEPK